MAAAAESGQAAFASPGHGKPPPSGCIFPASVPPEAAERGRARPARDKLSRLAVVPKARDTARTYSAGPAGCLVAVEDRQDTQVLGSARRLLRPDHVAKIRDDNFYVIVWVPITLSLPLIWCLLLYSTRERQVRHPAARGPLAQALSVLVPLRFAYLAVLRMLGWLALFACSDRAKDAEILLLRHQVSVLQRQVKTPRLSWADRAVLAALAQLVPASHLRQMRLIISPRTLLRWHARLVRRRWTYLRRARGRPRTPPRYGRWCWRWPGTIPAGATGASMAS